jgi:hypothetical protein
MISLQPPTLFNDSERTLVRATLSDEFTQLSTTTQLPYPTEKPTVLPVISIERITAFCKVSKSPEWIEQGT